MAVETWNNCVAKLGYKIKNPETRAYEMSGILNNYIVGRVKIHLTKKETGLNYFQRL
jgi:hypothetical protein